MTLWGKLQNYVTEEHLLENIKWYIENKIRDIGNHDKKLGCTQKNKAHRTQIMEGDTRK